MPHGGSAGQPRDARRQEAYLDSIRMHEDIDVTSLLGLEFMTGVLHAVDLHQQHTADVVADPFPADTYEPLKADLARNTTMYPDEIEDLLDTDPVLQQLRSLPATEERAVALRARRSTVVVILYALDKLGYVAEQSAPDAA